MRGARKTFADLAKAELLVGLPKVFMPFQPEPFRVLLRVRPKPTHTHLHLWPFVTVPAREGTRQFRTYVLAHRMNPPDFAEASNTYRREYAIPTVVGRSL